MLIQNGIDPANVPAEDWPSLYHFNEVVARKAALTKKMDTVPDEWLTAAYVAEIRAELKDIKNEFAAIEAKIKEMKKERLDVTR